MALPEFDQETLEQKRKRNRRQTRKLPKIDNSRAIAVLLILTVGLSLFFYLKTELPLFWQKIIKPTVISNLPAERLQPPLVLKEIENLTQELRGTYGVYVYRLETGEEYGLYQKEIFPAASLMKLPVMLTLYQEVEKENLSLETTYQLQETDKVSGAGVLQAKTAGASYTYRQLIKYMGQYSDNTAYGILSRLLGQKKIQTLINNLGMKKTSFAESQTSPQDIGRLFLKVYENEIINEENSQELLAFLTKTGYEDRIPAGIPQGVRVAHKIGTEIGNFSDAGIIFSENPFILVIMSKNAKEAEAIEVLPQIAQAVWDFETNNKSP